MVDFRGLDQPLEGVRQDEERDEDLQRQGVRFALKVVGGRAKLDELANNLSLTLGKIEPGL